MEMYQNNESLSGILQATDFVSVVPFEPSSFKIKAVDLSGENMLFTEKIYSDRQSFESFLKSIAVKSKATYLVGGYAEPRQMYRRSRLFDTNIDVMEDSDEPRSIHLGIDIWGKAGTPVSAPLGGMIHSLAYNGNFGDYGGTIILQHQLNGLNFHTLYGHLASSDLGDKRRGQYISRGETFAHFGDWESNGNWPPHLHFQIIADMGVYEGDYPGVCKLSEAVKYLGNCPDPELIMKWKAFMV